MVSQKEADLQTANREVQHRHDAKIWKELAMFVSKNCLNVCGHDLEHMIVHELSSLTNE